MAVGRSPVRNAETDSPVAHRTQCPFDPLNLFANFHFPRGIMNSRERNTLDRYNTGNYGEDQMKDDPPILDTDLELFEYPDKPDRSIDHDVMPATAVLPRGAVRDGLVNQIREMMALYVITLEDLAVPAAFTRSLSRHTRRSPSSTENCAVFELLAIRLHAGKIATAH